ncbi:MAG: 50S ribosomal protein L24 [Candidatus Sumerlaeaceae bacterium]|nr:50S ribosomal protein L24 [Candidatus Sumerlaeaceae bacterium]
MSLRIRKNDRVEVITGKFKGKVSRVLYVIPEKDRVVVESVNVVKRHQKARGQNRPAGIVEKEAPIHISNVLVYCEKCKSGSRFGVKVSDDGKTKSRFCKKCGSTIA